MPSSIIIALGFEVTATSIFIANVVIATASSFVISKMFAPDENQGQQGVRQQLPPSAKNAIPIVYGDAYLSGNFVDAVLSTDQQTMYYVMAISHISPDGQFSYDRTDFWYGDKLMAFDTTDQAKVISLKDQADNLDTKISGNMYVYLYTSTVAGVITNVNTTLSPSTVMGGTDILSTLRWSASNRQMNGLAFAIIKLKYNQDAGTTGLQRLLFKVSHYLKGAGAARPGDVFSDYLTNTKYGAAVDISDVNATACSELNSYSDAMLTYVPSTGGTATQPRYRINGVLDTSKPILENINQIVTSCDCWFAYEAVTGQWKPLINKEYITNILISPTDLSNAAWLKIGSTVTVDAIAAPDGSITADKINDTATTGVHIVYQGLGTLSGLYTFQGWLKAGGRNKGYLHLDSSGATDAIVFFDLSTGSITASTGTATITKFNNDWYYINVYNILGSGSVVAYIVMQDDSGNSTYTGNTSLGMYAWNLQVFNNLPPMLFNDANIIGAIRVSMTDLYSSINQIEVEFPFKENRDQANYVYLSTPLANRYVNEPENKINTKFELVNDSVQTTYLANRILLQSRQDLNVSFDTAYTGIQTNVGDVIFITNTDYGWYPGAAFRVMKVSEVALPDGNLGARIDAAQYDAVIYNDVSISAYGPVQPSSAPGLDYFSALSAPTVGDQLPNSTPATFSVSCTMPTTGRVTTVKLFYTSAAVPTTSDWQVWAQQTSADSTPFANGSIVKFTNIILPIGNYYFSFQVSNDVGTSILSPLSSVFAWQPGSTSGVVANFSAFVFDSQIAPTDAIAILRFSSDGTIKESISGAAYTDIGNWYLPTTASIGSTPGYWLYTTVVSGSLTSGTTGSWIKLDVNRDYNCTVTSNSGIKEADLSFQISSSSTGTPVVGYGTATINATVEI